jgi:ADP-ribose pyrophosphatase YjhB (NUDIX family)
MIKFCTHCGADVSFEIPARDALPRHVCKRCGHIQYENPRLVVGCVASWEDKILLCRRAIEPRLGYWTLPAGFMENGETTAEAATRETFEEAGAKIIIDAPFAMVSIAHINQVHLFYRGRLATADHAAGEESLEVCLVRPADIPWSDMAFRSVTHCLERYLDDVARGCFGFHETSLGPLPPGEAI